MVAFLSGLLLGLSMILPIGPQNLFVLNQGLLGGWRGGIIAASTTGLCDTLLIVAGMSGVGALIAHVPGLRFLLLWLGAAFLLFLAFSAFRAHDEAKAPVTTMQQTSTARQIGTGIALSWGNPHAILDTVVVLGGAIASQQSNARVAFAGGTIAASWLFFFTLATTAAIFGLRLPSGAQGWIRRVSGAIMLVFAVVLALEGLQSLRA